MSADDQECVMVKGLQSGASFFILKPVSRKDLENLWQFAFANKRGKVIIEEIKTTYPCTENTVIPETISPIAVDISNEKKESRMKAPVKGETRDAIPKKTKFIWASSFHIKFLEAIESIGLDKAVPKKILEIMNVKGLTREHVASHLQKYRLFMKKFFAANSEIQFDQIKSDSAPELRTDFFQSKRPVGGYFPISKYPKLGASSSFNQWPTFTSNSSLGSQKDLNSLLYNRNNTQQPMLETAKSIYDTNNLVYGNKPKFPIYQSFSEALKIGHQNPQVAQDVINHGLYMDKPSFEKIGAFSNQNYNLDPNFRKFEKTRTFGNKGLEGSSNFVFGNGLINGMGNENMNNVSVFGGTSGEGLKKLGFASSNNENQSTFEMIDKYPNSDNNGVNNFGINEALDYLSDSRNYVFLERPSDQNDASFTWPNQTNIQSQTQIPQLGSGDQEFIPKFGISGNPSSADQNFEPLDQNFYESCEEEFLRSVLSPGKDGEDRHGGTF